MKVYNYIIALMVILMCSQDSKATDTLTLEGYLDMITAHYPLIKKAGLYDEFTAAYQRKGHGTYDPKITSSWQSKDFSDTNYFNIWQTELKVPTSLPIDLSLGYENNDGEFLNAENNVPQSGLLYGTINITVLRGLIYDEQRYNVQAAELKGIKSQVEKDMLTREILYNAIQVYLSWAAAQEQYLTMDEFLNRIQERHSNVIDLYINGDKPAIDTIESRISLANAIKNKYASYNDLIIKRQKAAVFMWNDAGQPLAPNDDIRPAHLSTTINIIRAMAAIDELNIDNDPLLRKLENEKQLLSIKNKLERENLKPQLDLKYNTIVNLGKEGFDPTYSLNDYKYGVTIEVPLRNRKTQGNIQLNDVLISQNNYEQIQYRQKIRAQYGALIMSSALQMDIIDVVTEKVGWSQSLYEAEVFKFGLGESSVFMLNQREQKLLSAQIDLISSNAKYGKTISELYYISLGQRLEG